MRTLFSNGHTRRKNVKQRDDIVTTKPDKGSGVVVMDKSEYLRLLSEASINDSSKFRAVPLERPSSKGRPQTYYHPLLQKEKELESMLILRAKTALNVAICMIFFYIFLDNGVMNTPKRRILSLVFTVLCLKKSLLITKKITV